MEPIVKRFIALVILNIILLAIFLSKKKDSEPVPTSAQTEQVASPSTTQSKPYDAKKAQQLLKTGTIEELEDFIEKNPDSPDIVRLRSRLSDLRYKRANQAVDNAHSARTAAQTGSQSNTSSTGSSSRTSSSSSQTQPKVQPEPQIRRTLQNGAQPYAAWYGYNQRYDPDKFQSEISVTSSVAEDVIVIVKNNNKYGKVAGHLYIQAGHTGKIYVTAGRTYQVFFYYGDDWDENKVMKGDIRGGFTRHEKADEDATPRYLKLEETYSGYSIGTMSYNLNRGSGNFTPTKCSTDDAF